MFIVENKEVVKISSGVLRYFSFKVILGKGDFLNKEFKIFCCV